ncbi:MAG: dynamin family protein [Methylotetracoccus sp.]
MSTNGLGEKLRDHDLWREELTRTIERYREWLTAAEVNSEQVFEEIDRIRDTVGSDELTVAFLAEFSRGKTELINALFFADTGVRLLPSSPGRTTMCPTEIFYDQREGSYIRLIDIETRANERTLADLKADPSAWTEIPLDPTSPIQMQEAFRALAATRTVAREQAQQLGLYSEEIHESCGYPPEHVEIPCWRHALISFPHTLLRRGLVIVDTPGLNAMGAEPELTLGMLPKAQAVVFVLAADSGVTKSDVDVWRMHARKIQQNHRGGLIVVLNKIDSMWDDLQGEQVVEQSLKSQIDTTSRTLGVEPSLIFPISAKQGLLAKIRGDDLLLKRSRLGDLELYLAEGLVRVRQEILAEIVMRTLTRSFNEWHTVFSARLTNMERQSGEMREMGSKNHALTRRLMTEAHSEHAKYVAAVDALKKAMAAFKVQTEQVQKQLSPQRIQEIVERTRREMIESLTTFGMKAVMKAVLDELHLALSAAADLADQSTCLVTAMFTQFSAEPGFKDLRPNEFTIDAYRRELDEIFDQGEQFRTSSSSTSMYQTVVVNRLYGTLIARAQVLFKLAYDEFVSWSATVFVPLLEYVKERKHSVESRIDLYQKVSGRNESLDDEIANLDRTVSQLRQRLHDLATIREAVPALQSTTAVDDVADERTPGYGKVVSS